MHRPLVRSSVLFLSAAAVWAGDDIFSMRDITLDEEAFAAVRREMKANRPEPALSPEAKAWRGAMQADSGEGMAVRLLPLLMKLNPELPPEKYPELYTAALLLHVRARRGDAAAVAELAAALRCGIWKELVLPTDMETAEQAEIKGAF